MTRGNLSLIACNSGRALGERIVKELCKIYTNEGIESDFKLVDTEEVYFANGEIKTVINEKVRGDDLYIVQCVYDPLSDRSINDNFIALLTAINAAYQSDAEQITVIIPHYPYSRQERRKTREGIQAKTIATILENLQVKRVITIDVHSEAIAGFFTRTKFESLHASKFIIDHFNMNYKDLDREKFMVVAPDVGSADRARFYSKSFKTKLAIIDKKRDYTKPSVVEKVRLVGEVRGYDVFIPDDLIDTGGTIISACRLLKEEGANDIYVATTHPFFTGNAVEKFTKAYEEGIIKKVIGTDSIFRGEEFLKQNKWYEEVSIAQHIASVMYTINKKKSVSELLV